jgi:hypothetical protein
MLLSLFIGASDPDFSNTALAQPKTTTYFQPPMAASLKRIRGLLSKPCPNQTSYADLRS